MDNKLFCKTIKPSFSDKIVTRDRIHLTENGEVVKTELETAETLNNFFGNVIKSLMIPKYNEYDPSTDRVKNRTIRAILKYRNHPSIPAIREQKKAQINFCFKEVSIEETQKEVLNLNNKKASQNSDIPTKIIKEKSDIFGKALYSFISDSIKSFTLQAVTYQKYLKKLCLNKCLLFLKTFLTNNNADSVKIITPSNVY